jgi:type IV secretion system protein VirD4
MRFALRLTIVLMGYACVLTVIVIPYAWVVAAIVVIAALRSRRHSLSAYGTARWAIAADMPHMLDGNGLMVGQLDGKIGRVEGVKALFDPGMSAKDACQKFLVSSQRKQPKQTVRLTNAVHTAVFAPTGVGKGVSCVVPFLLTCPDSAVVIDFKGENTLLTAQARRKMGHRVVVIDPFKITTKEPDTFNPLEFIDKDATTAIDECRDLAEALVVRTGQEKDPHWNDAGEIFIAAMTSMVVSFAESGDKNLQSVRSLLTDPDKMQAAIKIMCESPDIWEGMLSRLGNQLTQFKDKELASCLTTTNRFMRFLDTIAVADSTRRSSFNPADLLEGKMTMFLVLPPEHQRAQSPLLRLWIGSMLRAVVKGGLQEKSKVHFILDEAASLGHMESLDDAVDKYRGYGVRLQLYYQSLGQLKKCWPEAQDQTLLSNTTQVFFGVNDQQTAEYVSNRLGEFTLVVSSGGKSIGGSEQHSSGQGSSSSYSRSWNANDNWQQAGRKLLKPEEVAGLSQRIAITFTPGVPPIWTRLVRYYESGFRTKRGIGPVRSVIDTACLFLTAATLAVLTTASVIPQPYR